MTLLEKALKEQNGATTGLKHSPDELELAIAWAQGKIGARAGAAALGLGQSSNFYAKAASILRDGLAAGKIKIVVVKNEDKA